MWEDNVKTDIGEICESGFSWVRRQSKSRFV